MESEEALMERPEKSADLGATLEQSPDAKPRDSDNSNAKTPGRLHKESINGQPHRVA